MNKRNIMIVAIMAIMLMGSVVLSAVQSTFIIRNVYSISSHDPVEIWFYTDFETVQLYDLESSTLTITITYYPGPGHWQATPSVHQGDRVWIAPNLYPPGTDFNLELPGPYEVRPTPGSNY